ncbi:MAG: DUF2971 domain-containing protein [Nitrosomonas sp.]|nr:DUF2971 domain-containing protein [Nitrosomonas sp.]MDP1950886.1 DUF2971 domain-containing protein [Nitrosomonas sp.]
MSRPLAEDHPELFHYTNATGLTGIIQSQTLWATHYAYLNDSEEIRHFLKGRLPDILRPIIGARLDELIKQDVNTQSLIDREGGKEKTIDRFIEETLAAQVNTLLSNQEGEEPLAEPYITSFCSTKDKDDRINEHGLLSQWRGYGRDGGYAIVFDTARLSQLLEEVGRKWENGLDLFFGDVVYSFDPDPKFRDEFDEDLSVIKNFYEDSFRGTKDEDTRGLDKIYSALMRCACRYKHWGFEEENEVRIVAIPHPTRNKEFCEHVRADGIIISEVPRKHYLRSGTLIPFIDLLESITSVSEKPLPVKRIIVGPSVNAQERRKRIRAVELLIAQHGIKADVSASEIPYIS